MGNSRHGVLVQNTMSSGILHQVSPSVQLQLLQDMGTVGLHCLYTDDEAVGYFLVGVTISNKLEDLFLSARQFIVVLLFLPPPHRIEVASDNHLGCLGAEKGLVPVYGTDGTNKLGISGLFHQVARGPGF